MKSCFVDAHLHLQDPRFDGLTGELVSRAQERGVTRLFCNAVDEADWPLIGELAAEHHSVVPFLGIHPWRSDSVRTGWQDRLVRMAEGFARFGGIGEIGLDKSCPVDFSVQAALFSAQLQLAAEHGWPVAVHCVRAWGPLVETLTRFSQNQKLPRTMVHAYNGSTETMKQLTGLGCYISFSEALAIPQQTGLRQTFALTPPHLMLLETDAPYDKNPDAPGKTAGRTFNEPADVAGLYGCAADLLSLSSRQLGSMLWNNATVFTN